ncbi:MAG: glycosyltransferase, partial [Candidatus Pacebacteria bacterium]|nr:glycosyltransferase [Candidatus Paceibacterota bacterium]
NSCYTQGFQNDEFEVLMVDDGSTDSTPALIKQLALEHKNIRYFFHEKNQGGGATRNTAVAKSLSEVIFCLDSDDLLPAGSLSKMYQYLKEKKCDGVSIHRSIKFGGNNIKNIDHIDVSPYPDKKIPFKSLIRPEEEFCPLDVTFMYTKNAFQKIGGYPTKHGFDTQGFSWRFLCAGLVAYTCPDAEYLHRIHFTRSYYLREYDAGRVNYNWRDILLEHYYVFNPKALHFITAFDCSNFTRNIMDELRNLGDIFVVNLKDVLEKPHPPININLPEKIYIRRNSLQGYVLRVKQYRNVSSLFRKIAKKLRLSPTTKKFLHRITKPATFYFLRNTSKPLSNYYGLERGEAIDRFFIENFLKENKQYIRGACLELLNNKYTNVYGGEEVTKSDILDIEDSNQKATIIDDLRQLKTITDNAYDCIILTQVFQFIDDLAAAISECHRVLKKGGTILATLPCLSRIDCVAGLEGDYWRFTLAGAKYLFQKKFLPENLSIKAHGNVRSGLFFYAGLAQEDISLKALKKDDSDFPTIISVRAIK